MITWHARALQPAQYRPATAYCLKLGKSGTRRSPGVAMLNGEVSRGYLSHRLCASWPDS